MSNAKYLSITLSEGLVEPQAACTGGRLLAAILSCMVMTCLLPGLSAHREYCVYGFASSKQVPRTIQAHRHLHHLFVVCLVSHSHLACRVLFAPNVHDASPRVLAEAMSLDVPILVNKYIVGGWKYVNRDTGAFFDSVDNVVDAYKDIVARQQAGELRPRQWFK